MPLPSSENTATPGVSDLESVSSCPVLENSGESSDSSMALAELTDPASEEASSADLSSAGLDSDRESAAEV